jgi:hypothetical protein
VGCGGLEPEASGVPWISLRCTNSPRGPSSNPASPTPGPRFSSSTNSATCPSTKPRQTNDALRRLRTPGRIESSATRTAEAFSSQAVDCATTRSRLTAPRPHVRLLPAGRDLQQDAAKLVKPAESEVSHRALVRSATTPPATRTSRPMLQMTRCVVHKGDTWRVRGRSGYRLRTQANQLQLRARQSSTWNLRRSGHPANQAHARQANTR